MAKIHLIPPSAYSYNDVVLVGGLTWFTGGNLSHQDANKRAKEEGKSLGKDAFAVRAVSKKNFQYGIVDVADATKKAAPFSAAAVIIETAKNAKRMPATWAGCFDLGGGLFQWIEVRDDAIVPDGDRVVSAEVAETLLNGARDAGIETLVDPGFGFERAVNFSLADLLGERPRLSSSLRVFRPGDKAARSLKIFVIPGLLLLLVGVAVGGYFYVEQQEQIAKAKAAALAKMSTGKAVTTIELPKAWLKRPSAVDTARRCLLAHVDTQSSPAGWLLEKTECDESRAVHTFVRQSSAGTFASLVAAIGEVSIDDSGTNAQQATDISLNSYDEREIDADSIVHALFVNEAQRNYLKYTIGAASAPVIPLPPQGQVYLPPDWRARVFSVEGSLSRFSALEPTLTAPGQRVSKVSIQGNRILIEGQLYAK